MGRICLYLAVWCLLALGLTWMTYQLISAVSAVTNSAAGMEISMDQGAR